MPPQQLSYVQYPPFQQFQAMSFPQYAQKCGARGLENGVHSGAPVAKKLNLEVAHMVKIGI
jgi:hypothetical protein